MCLAQIWSFYNIDFSLPISVNFLEEAAGKEWDRVQIICRQMWKKDAQMGLSFLRLSSQRKTAETTLDIPSEGQKPGAKNSVEDIQKHFFGDKINNK